MTYHSETIQNVVSRLNQEYFLPAIQREFVWGEDQICQLFDSLMRRYPISTFLFWEVPTELRDKVEIYEFIDRAEEGGNNHNKDANIHGKPKVILVLDGQQRLTSLNIGLKGSYVSKRKRKHRTNPNAWLKKRLYLDLLGDALQPDGGDETGMRYSFQFFPEAPTPEREHYWYEVGCVLDYASEDEFDRARRELARTLQTNNTTPVGQDIIDRNLKRLYDVVWTKENVSFHTETEPDEDRVLDIFVRTNSGGTKLSKSDLLLAMISAGTWGGNSPREEIHRLVDELNHTVSPGSDFSKDFVMKSCLVLADLEVEYRLRNFNRQNLDTIREQWPSIRKFLRAGVEFASRFGIRGDALTSANALIPIVYYMKSRNTTLLGSSIDEDASARSARRWLLGCLLMQTFGGHGDNLLREMRRVIKTEAGTFPAAKLHEVASKGGRPSVLDRETVETVLDYEYGRPNAFLALSLLYDEKNWGTTIPEQDHIFPQDLFKPKRMDDAGIPKPRQAEFLGLRDRMGNLELLPGNENAAKSNQDFATWLRTRNSEFRTKHLIPEDDNLLRLERFDQFVKQREKLIRTRLERVLLG